jgi:hypothetical protein
MKKTVFTGLLAGIIFALILAQYTYADTGPHTPGELYFYVTYNNQTITQNFTAEILACFDVNCSTVDNYAECSQGQCFFAYYRYERVPPIMKLQVNLTGDIYTSETFNYTGSEFHYESYYNIDITPNEKIFVNNTNNNGNGNNLIINNDMSTLYSFVAALIITIVIELAVAFLFFKKWKIKKLKRPLLTIVVANIISVPIVWIIWLNLLPLLGGLAILISEIFAIVFETYFFYHFNKKIVTLKKALILSLIMNIVSFVFGFFLLASVS